MARKDSKMARKDSKSRYIMTRKGIEASCAGLSGAGQKTPLILIRGNIISKQLERFKHCFCKFNPSIFYSVKTNPHPEVIKLLKKKGIGFQACSVEELATVLFACVKKSRIIMYSPSFTIPDFKKIGGMGIRNIIIDSEQQFEELCKSGVDARVLLRISALIKPRNCSYRGNGLGLTFKECLSILGKTSHEKGSGVRIVGLHMHIASQNRELSIWKRDASAMLSFVKKLKATASSTGISRIRLIDFGGGFPVAYDQDVPELEEIAKCLSPIFRELKRIGIGIAFEPGRFLVAPAGSLVTKVLIVTRNHLIVDASIYTGAIDSLIGIRLPITDKGRGRSYVIRGKSPCSLDIFGRAVLGNICPGETLVLKNAGAYVYGSDFMGYPRLKILYCEENKNGRFKQ